MGLIRTMGGFCYVECDTRNCSKKMEHVDERLLRELARLCGWKGRGNEWICPKCTEIPSKGAGKTSRSRQKTQISLQK